MSNTLSLWKYPCNLLCQLVLAAADLCVRESFVIVKTSAIKRYPSTEILATGSILGFSVSCDYKEWLLHVGRLGEKPAARNYRKKMIKYFSWQPCFIFSTAIEIARFCCLLENNDYISKSITINLLFCFFNKTS